MRGQGTYSNGSAVNQKKWDRQLREKKVTDDDSSFRFISIEDW